jgi:hypothetical protein
MAAGHCYFIHINSRCLLSLRCYSFETYATTSAEQLVSTGLDAHPGCRDLGMVSVAVDS